MTRPLSSRSPPRDSCQRDDRYPSEAVSPSASVNDDCWPVSDGHANAPVSGSRAPIRMSERCALTRQTPPP